MVLSVVEVQGCVQCVIGLTKLHSRRLLLYGTVVSLQLKASENGSLTPLNTGKPVAHKPFVHVWNVAALTLRRNGDRLHFL